MPIDDEDLFDAPAQPKKPSNKIVYQPAGAQWSLDRLGEVESLYQTSFKKKLPLANRGQGSVHNRFGYDHRNSADVSLNPSSPEGQQFVEQLKKANVPFLAFSSAIPGVSTGPHIHLGFPSKRSQQKFNVGSQRKKKHVASEDLFDKDDDDLFDSMEQNPPSTSEQIQSAESTAGRSAPSMPRGRFVLAGKGAKWARPPRAPQAPQSKLFQQLGQQRTVDQIQRQQEQAALDEAKADLQSERGPYGAPTGRGILRLFSSPFSKFGELAKSDEQIIQERAQEKLKAQRIAQDPEVTESRKAYGQMSSGRRIVQRPLEKAGASILQTGGGLASGFGIAPNQLSDWMNRRGQLIESAASLPPLAEEQTLSSLITGEKELKEVDVGAIEKIATGVTDLGLGLGQIILLKRASKLSFPNLLALEAAAKNSDKPASEQAARAAEGYALGQGLERLTSRAANAALSGIPTAAQTGYEVAQGRMSPLDAAIQTGIQTGVGAILPPAGPSRRQRVAGRLNEIAETESQLAPRIGLKERIQRRNERSLPPEVAEAAKRYTELSDEMVRLNNEYSDATRNNLSESEVDALLRRHRELVLQQRPLEAQITDAGYRINPIGEVVKEGETFPSILEDDPERRIREGIQQAQAAVPERGETVQAQIDSGRPVVLITPGTPRPKLPQGMRAEKTSEGVFYYDPTQIDVRMIRGKVADGTFGELLGHVEPKSESTTEAVVARDAEGNEIQSSAVSPENVEAQAEVLKTQYPEAQVETGGPELAQEVIAERTGTQQGAVKQKGIIELNDPVPDDVLRIVNRTFNQMVGPDIYNHLPEKPTTQDVIELLAEVGLSDQIMQESVPALRKAGYSRIGDVLITDEGLRVAPKELPPALSEPQKFYHRDFGEVIKTESQEGARAGRTRVQEADNPDAIHYVKTAQLTGAGNQRMVPVKPEPSTGQEQRGGPTVETPAEVETPETAILAKDQGETGKLGGYSSPSKTGEEGFINVSPEKAEYKPATTPVLKDVERATLDAENRRPSLRQFGRRATSYLQRALVAEFTPLRELEAKLYGKEDIPLVNMARKFEQVAGAPAKAQADVIDFRRAVVDPIRKHADDFNSYLFLKRVEDRLSRDPERKKVADWSIEKARTGLDELKAKVGDETYKQLEAAGDAYQKEMDKALRLQVESGRMSEDLYEQIVNSRDFYAPFKVLRHIEESEFLKGTGRRVATTQDLTKKIAGIEKEDFQLGNILQASAEQIVRSRILAEKNLKMLELDRLADLDPKGDLIRRVEKDDERPKQGYQFVRLLKDGKEKILEVEDVVADAVQGLNPKQASLLSQVMAMARRPLQLGATSANAGFQAVNLFFADLPRQALVSRYGVKSAKDLYQFPLDWTYSLLSSIKGNFGKPNQLYMDWLRSGAANSTVQRELTPEAFRPTLGIAKPGVKNLASSALNSVAKFSNAIEETSKILGLKRGMKAEQIAKMSPAERQQAMEKIAAEVRNYSGSPDFARRGSETRELNLLFMFFNARLQGITSDLTRLAGKTGKKEGAVAWARLGTAIGIPTTLLALLNNSDEYKEDYAKIPDWEKKSYWMIPRDSYFTNDDGEQIRDYWRIPKRELGQLFGNTIESAVEFAYKRDPKTAKQWSIDMLENLSPINLQGKTMGERAESAFSGLNPALKLPAEAIMNRDTFRHRDIVPEYMRKAKPSEQYRESTPRPYRMAGKALGVSPLQLEHAVEGATGSAVSQFNIRPQPEGRSQLAGYPIARRFFRSGSVAKDESLDQAQQDVATKQLERRRARQEAIKKYRAGQISKEELDRLESEDVLTESDVKRVEKEAGMTPRQVNFHSKAPVDALVAYERMTSAQRDHVKDIMSRKAYTLLHSEALTEAQKAEFEQRINQLGITPEAPRRQSANPFKQRFSSSFK